MKPILLFFLVIILPIIANAEANSKERAFAQFVKRFGKTYANEAEKASRFEIFSEKYDKIKSHNKRFDNNEVKHKEGINQFSDLTQEELAANNRPAAPLPRRSKRQSTSTVTVPTSWTPDTRDLSVSAIPVKNQLSCGSSWAFSAIDVFTFRLYNTTNPNHYYDLSEQMCVDCARAVGCNGGWPSECFSYIKSNGANFETVYNYTSTNGTCKYNDTSIPANGIPASSAYSWVFLPPGEKRLAYILDQYGWVSVTINSNTWYSYSSGIIEAASCNSGPNHAVTVVGYGTESGVKYWLIKNTWGSTWGDNGYVKIERGANACDINHSYDPYRTYLDW